MKKIYLVAAAALLATAPISARELTFYNGSTAITNGSTIESQAFDVTPIGNNNVEIYFEPDLYLAADYWTNSVNLTAKCVSGHTIQLCTPLAAGQTGSCQTGTEVTKQVITISSSAKIALKYEYVVEQSESDAIPVVVTEFSAVDTKYTTVTADFTVVMGSNSGVTSVFANDASFKAVNGGIAYEFAGRTEVALYSLSGEKVLATVLEGQGVLSTSHLPAGIYAYTAGSKSGKVYLR